MVSKRMAAVALALLLGGWPESAAWGQSLEEKETARSLMERGDSLLEARDLKGALEAYVAADEIMRVPTTGLARARVLVSLGRLIEASDVLLRVSRAPAKPGEDPVLGNARAEATRIASEISGRIPSLTIELAGLPKDAVVDLTIDGRPISSSVLALPIKLDPGKHRLTLKSLGYVSIERELSVAESETAKLLLSLQPDPAGKEPAVPSNEKPQPAAPLTEPGKDGGGIPAWPWVVGGLGAAALVTSGVSLGIQLSAASTLDERCGEERTACPGDYDFAPDRSSEEIGQALFIGFGIGGLIGVGTAVIGIATAPSSAAPTVAWRIEPFGGSETAGLTFSTRLD